jgi:hypothetical protein
VLPGYQLINNTKNIADGEMQDYRVLEEIFVRTVGQTLANLSDANAVKVREKLLEITGGWTASYLFSQDHFGEKNAEVYADEVFRDWLFNTRFVFMTNASFHCGLAVHALVLDMLARSVSLDMGVGEDLKISDHELVALSAMPEQFPQEILNYEDAKKLLAANNWVCVVLLVIAFIPMEHEVLKTPVPDNNQNN